MRRLTVCAGTAWLALFLAGSGRAAPASSDWFQWRGPNRDGHSADTGLLQQWPAGGPPLVWKATGLGAGFAGVAVSGDRLFSMGDKDGASQVIALNRADGRLLWTARVGKAGAPGWGGFAGPRCTPTVAGGLVFAVDQWGELVCVDAATGKEQWRKNFEKDFGGSRPEWGFAESPLVDGDQVVVTPGGPRGAIVALEARTGALRWQSKEFTDEAQYASLLAVEPGGVRQYIQLTMSSLVGVAAADGRVLWKARRKGATAVIPTPVYADGHVFVCSGYNIGCNLFKISSASPFAAEELYANKNLDNHHGGVVKVGDHLYGHANSKGWVCLDFKTGALLWNESAKLGKGSVSFADGRLYCREEAEKGVVALLEPTPQGFKEHGRFTPPDRSGKKSWPHPVISGGRLYLRDQDVLLCYDLKAR